MIKALEQAVEKVRKLSAEEQQYIADVLEQIVAETDEKTYSLSDAERQLIREGLDELDGGETATDEDARAVFHKYRS